jgi:hypothetical protein
VMGLTMTGTDLQAVMSISIPTFAVLVGILINNSRLSDLRSYMGARFEEVNRRFDDVDRRFDDVDRRFESMNVRWDEKFEDLKQTWRAELRRVEDVIDARLKHLEER